MPTDEQNAPASDQAQGAESATKPADGPKFVTADDLKAFGDSMAANMRRMMDGLAKPKGRTRDADSDAESKPDPMKEAMSLMRLRDDLNDALAEHSHLDKERRGAIRELAEWKRPEDVAGFVAQQARLYGARSSAESPAANQPKQPAPSAGRPVSDVGAPSDPPQFTEDTPLWKLSPEHRARLRKEKGDYWYATTLRKQAKGVRVLLR